MSRHAAALTAGQDTRTRCVLEREGHVQIGTIFAAALFGSALAGARHEFSRHSSRDLVTAGPRSPLAPERTQRERPASMRPPGMVLPYAARGEAIMRGVGLTEFGGPEVLRVVDLPEVHAGPGEIRIRVHAAAVNPTDTGIRDGSRAEMLKHVSPPHIPGMDAAGVIDAIGPDTATDLMVGDAVMAMVIPLGSHGAYRESLVLAAAAVARAPAGASHAAAATLPMNGLTARLSLDQLALTPGQTLAVTGAAGCYGGYVVQLAKAAGLRVIADASAADEQLVRELGADIVVRRGDDIASTIRAIAPDGVDGLADGAVQNELAVGAVRDGGVFASVRGWAGNGERGIRFHRTMVRTYDQRADLLDQLRQQVEAGRVSLRVAATYPIDQAAAAHRRLEAGGTRGRCVILF
jgi:NADPH:quinone reductase